MNFLEERLHSSICYPTNTGEEFEVDLTETAAYDYTALVHPFPRTRFALNYNNKTIAQHNAYVKDIFMRAGGMAGGCRVRNKNEFSTNNYIDDPTHQDQYCSVIDAGAKTYQLTRWYGIPSDECPRRILYKIVAGTVKVSIKTSGVWTPTLLFTVNLNTGVITMTNTVPPGSEVWAGCEFDIPCRFLTNLSNISLNAGRVLSVTPELIEILNPEDFT